MHVIFTYKSLDLTFCYHTFNISRILLIVDLSGLHFMQIRFLILTANSDHVNAEYPPPCNSKRTGPVDPDLYTQNVYLIVKELNNHVQYINATLSHKHNIKVTVYVNPLVAKLFS